MKKKILCIVIGIILIGAIITAIITIKNVKEQGTPVEKFMKDEEWVDSETVLIQNAEHNWKISDEGKIKCSHCEKKYEIGDIIKYSPADDGERIKLDEELTGYSEVQTVTREDAVWIVFGITEDGKGLLITTEKPLNQKDSILFKGAQAYNNGIEALDTVCRVLYSNSEYGFARCMSLEDVSNFLGYENPTSQYSYVEQVDSGEEGADPNVVAKEKWISIENKTTKLKDIPLFEDAIKNGTCTPDGVNTAEALGEYYINGYNLQSSPKVEDGKCIIRVFGTEEVFEVDAEKQDIIFGIHNSGDMYTYWLASTGVSICKDFVGFGMGMIQDGNVGSCCEMFDSRGEDGLYYTAYLKPGIRPVVELYAID